MELVIVESPTKAKTIQKFLGKPYEVLSSYGHVRDLPKSKMGIDTENDFAAHYIIPTRARKNVTALKKKAAKAKRVILATDEDREGEAIAWHLVAALDLKDTPTERIAFHEITKEAIEEALKKPRAIDENLVNAQQARRLLDRLVGYELSPFLWRKIYRGLSAGRVQSVAVRMVVEREREINAFKAEEYWTIEADLNTKNNAPLTATVTAIDGKRLEKFDIQSKEDADKHVAELNKATYAVTDVIGKETKKKPPTPFTTSLLQQDASRRLSMSPKQTMVLAQQLYEGVTIGEEGSVGLITYMRTDSMNLGEKFLLDTAAFLEDAYGKQYALPTPRRFKSKSKNAQEAHEAIRPTDPRRTPEVVAPYLDPRQRKLYQLIWQRTIASQMPEAEVATTTINISTAKTERPYELRASGSVVTFDGWRKVYPTDTSDIELPSVTKGDALTLKAVDGKQHFTEALPRFTDASLIKALEEHGIGRPSTYAPTISTITDRGYVERQERRLHPTDLAYLVNDLLVEHFPEIVDYEFTARIERDLDDIAEGNKEYIPILRDFYVPFKKHLEEKDALLLKSNISEEATDEVCEKCGKPMISKLGRFGKFLACTGFPECKNTKPIKGSPEEAAEKEATNEVCDKCGKPMQLKRGRFGPFLGCTGYPECKGIKSIAKSLNIKCPECGKGDIIEKRSRRGKTFYSCNRYPDCTFALWSRPTGEFCPTCKSLLVMGAKGTVRCSSKECPYKTEAAED
ncbi:MAG: type I DNA topoisomerase [Patescibacteria group bacterium]|jgi:DNA topoisomerase-1